LIHKVRWTAEKIAERIKLIEPLVYQRRQPLPPFRYQALSGPLAVPPVGPDVDPASWPEIQPNTYWGRWVTDFVLRGHFQVPVDWDPTAPVALYLPLGNAGEFIHPEALAYVDGTAYGTCDRYHDEILLPSRWCDGQLHQLALHGWTGLGGDMAPGEAGTQLFMRGCAVVQIDQPTRDFVATARVALGVANSLDKNEPAIGQLVNALDAAFHILDTREPFGEAFYASVAPAHAALQAGIEKAGPPLDVTITATGHAHLDVAWLWTVNEIRRKAGRTFHTVLRLMEQFPEYHFTQSQPQLYDFVRQDYPELFAAIKQRVAEGRWEPIGGMWVEADCNLSGPESLARQFLLGRSFFREHFGPKADSPVMWLPDVFGYAWALPQLIKEAGLEYFFTIKIGWNQYNRLPYDTFWWQGVDGTRVLTHFSTTPDPDGYGTSTYNAVATPEQAIGTWTNFQQKELEHSLLMAFGHGDGGGGPTREMLENIREMAAFPATPRIRQADAGNFFHGLEATAGDRLPTWNGELYLELHRGTLTTQSRNKRANRKSEFRLHDAEFLAAMATILDPAYAYPAQTLRQAWELVCLNQFHDIIPGSSIGPVYVESQRQYAEIEQMAADVRAQALSVIGRHLGGEANTSVLLANPSGFPRHDLSFWPGQLPAAHVLRRVDGAPVPAQATPTGTWIAAGELPPFSVTRLIVAEGETPTPDASLLVTPTLLENRYLRVELNSAGDVTRLYDRANQREILPGGAVANQFQAFEDRPLNWDAWDVDIYFDEKMWTSDPATTVNVVEAGPLRATLEIRRRILHSDYVQRISLAFNRPGLEVDTHIDWRERHILLKVAFPVDILAPSATYEIQWGNVQRPTHRNTSWDWARFETCAQKWVDLSEGGYGVSLLNDCKYGHDVQDNVMRLSLLRSPTLPDPEADQGEHHFAYTLWPHTGGWEGSTVAAAYALNDPLVVFPAQALEWTHAAGTEAAAPGAQSLIQSDAPNIVIETVKQAEDGNGIIVRFYESQRRRGRVMITASFHLQQAWQTNLLEDNQAALTPDGSRLSLFVRPYQIVTLRLVPAPA
jgi:alpha-mannosidase